MNYSWILFYRGLQTFFLYINDELEKNFFLHMIISYVTILVLFIKDIFCMVIGLGFLWVFFVFAPLDNLNVVFQRKLFSTIWIIMCLYLLFVCLFVCLWIITHVTRFHRANLLSRSILCKLKTLVEKKILFFSDGQRWVVWRGFAFAHIDSNNKYSI